MLLSSALDSHHLCHHPSVDVSYLTTGIDIFIFVIAITTIMIVSTMSMSIMMITLATAKAVLLAAAST